MCSRWGAITNPHAQVFDIQHTQVPPLGHDPGVGKSSVWYVLYHLFVRTHTKFGIKESLKLILQLKFNDIWPFDLTQGLELNPRIKKILVFCSIHHPCQFDIPHDHIQKNGPPAQPPPPLPSPNPGAWPRCKNKNSIRYVFYLLFVRAHTKFGIKTFEIDIVIKI